MVEWKCEAIGLDRVRLPPEPVVAQSHSPITCQKHAIWLKKIELALPSNEYCILSNDILGVVRKAFDLRADVEVLIEEFVVIQKFVNLAHEWIRAQSMLDFVGHLEADRV